MFNHNICYIQLNTQADYFITEWQTILSIQRILISTIENKTDTSNKNMRKVD